MTSKLETKGVRVFLGNIPFEADEKDMRAICELAGRVVEFRFVMDNKRHRHKGTGFCEYPDVDTAQAAIRNLNKYPIRGRELIVDWADNEMKSKSSLSKILNLDQFDQVGNRISGLMKRGEQEVQKIDPQDTGILGEVGQVVHQMSSMQCLYVVQELQRMMHQNPEGTKEYLKEHHLLAHALSHMIFMCGLAEESSILREATRRADDDETNVFTNFEEETLKARAGGFRDRIFPTDFKPVQKDAVSLHFLRKLERMSQAEMFDYLRNLKPEEVAALPTELQLQAQAVRASQKDTVRTDDWREERRGAGWGGDRERDRDY